MDSSQSSSKVSTAPLAAGRDVFWAIGEKVVATDTNRIRCNYCKQVINGGITRFKHHLAGIKGNVKSCPHVPTDVRAKAEATLAAAQTSKLMKSNRLQSSLAEVVVGEDVDPDCSQRNLFEGGGSKGPMDQFIESGKSSQSTIEIKFKKKARDDAALYIARWAYEMGIPFNALYSISFQQMLHVVGLCGPGLKGPTPYEMREKFLQMEVQRTKEMLSGFTQTCRLHGCSILTDAWTDRKGRSVMNIVVHTVAGVAFWLSKNVSSSTYDGKFIYESVDEAISSPDGPGEANIVQVVTDNIASNNMAASRLLAIKRPKIFWTSCAAHTINLLLQDISKLKQIKSAITMSRQLTILIYAHTIALAMFRETTKDMESHDLVRSGVTRFATAFLSLQSLQDKRRYLREMFTSAKWEATKLSSITHGKQATTIALSATFWRNVELALLVFTPLVKVLRRADGDVPSMGWLYGDMKKAKEEVVVALENKENRYLPIWKLIDSRIESKMSNPLHLAGYFLNPFFYYPNKEEVEADTKFMHGFVECLTRMYANNPDIQDQITSELDTYQFGQALFGKELAKRQLLVPTFNPTHWWKLHAVETPNMRGMAMRILSLTTSSSGCERNWSTFEMIHSKKRNRLESKRLNDLVFVKFNAMLKSKHADISRDPISTKSLDEGKAAEWLVGSSAGDNENEEEVFPGEGLTWQQLGDIVDADLGPRRSTRPSNQQSQNESLKRRRIVTQTLEKDDEDVGLSDEDMQAQLFDTIFEDYETEEDL